MGKLYVITHRDLDLAYQAVQGLHAATRWSRENVAHHWWNNETVAFLSTKDEKELQRLIQKANVYGYTVTEFYEPDIGNKLTAITCFSEDGKIFRGLKKLGEIELKKVA
jgi:hypothetical protein